MTFDANNNMNVNHNMPNIDLGAQVYRHLHHQRRLKFINPNYAGLDFHGSNNIYLTNCNFYAGGSWIHPIFLGTATQIFFDHCNFYGAYDNITFIDEWGTTGLSITNCTAQDYDNTQTWGWAIGRFLSGNDLWNHSRYTYLGSNTTHQLTVRPGCSEQNCGEQIMWEGNNVRSVQATPTSATSTTVTFANLGSAPLANYATEEAVIVSGTGMGQHRQITAENGQHHHRQPALAHHAGHHQRDGPDLRRPQVAVWNNYFEAKSYASATGSISPPPA